MFRKPMKMRDLEVWGVPSCIVDIWEKNYSPYLLAVQEEAVRNYGVLDYNGSTGLPSPLSRGQAYCAPRNDIIDRRDACPTVGPEIASVALLPRNDRNGSGNNRAGRINSTPTGGNDRGKDLLVVAPTSSGKTFIGEMAAITQAIHKKKAIYLVPLRSLAEEKYRHFKKLYGGADCKIDIRVSSRDRREDDRTIIKGEYQIAVIVYEKFNYFLLKYPKVLKDVSLIIIDELQMIHDPVRGPLLEVMIEHIRKKNPEIRLIGLSAYLENETGFLSWFPASHLLSYKRPVELRKGIMRGGIFRYVTHNKCEYGEEEFFKVEEGQDTSYEDCLKNTVSCFIEKDEPTLLFFPTKKETRKWAAWLAGAIDAPRAEGAIAELSRMEETRSRDELLYLLEKGMAYHNADLSWEERNLVENYLQDGEIKIICATTTLAMGINLPFKNVILSGDKYVSDNGDYKESYRTSLSLADVENMGGRAGRLNWKKGEFGRVIFLADSLFAETVLQNVYFKPMKEDKERRREMMGVGEAGELYIPALKSSTGQLYLYRPVKGEKDFITFLLKAVVSGKDSKDKLKNYLKGVAPNFKGEGGGGVGRGGSYWVFDFEKGDLEKEIDFAVEELVKHNLITETEGLSPTEEGILICAKGIGIKTYLYFKEYLKNKKGKLGSLEMITLLALSEESRRFFLPPPQFGYITERYNWNDWKGQYYRKMRHLVLEAGEEHKEVYRDIFDEENISLDTEDFLSIKKAVLLYDWMGEKEIKEIEDSYKIYGGSIQKLGEGFSWLADALGGVAENLGWDRDKKKPDSGKDVLTEKDKIKKDNLEKIKVLSERLAWGVEEEGLGLARLHIPGLGRTYIRALLREGYNNRKCLEELDKEELAKVVPERLAGRIKGRFSGENYKVKDGNLQDDRRRGLTTILEIDTHRPDRIIFMREKIEVTATEFSLIHLLARHNEQVMSYEELLKELWKDEEDAIYNRVSFHLSKIRRTILQIVGENKTSKEKLKYIFAVIPGRGAMLRLKAEEIKIS